MVVYDIQNLTKIYPQHSTPANSEINLQIQEGEIFGLLGDNGAGKSTLVRQMVNLLQPTSGSVSLFGNRVNNDPLFVPNHVGYMPQDAEALNNLTVGEVFYFTAHLRGLNRGDARQERDTFWHCGRWKRCAISIVCNFRAVSDGCSVWLWQWLACYLYSFWMSQPMIWLLKDGGWSWISCVRSMTSVISRSSFITHDAIEAEKIIERVGILSEGELVAVGRPSELKAQVENCG